MRIGIISINQSINHKKKEYKSKNLLELLLIIIFRESKFSEGFVLFQNQKRTKTKMAAVSWEIISFSFSSSSTSFKFQMTFRTIRILKVISFIHFAFVSFVHLFYNLILTLDYWKIHFFFLREFGNFRVPSIFLIPKERKNIFFEEKKNQKSKIKSKKL